DLKVNEAITPEHRKIVNDLFTNYHTGLIRHLEKACAVMNVVQKKVKRHERTRGDATVEEKTELETARAEYERLKALAAELSSALGVPMVELKEEPSDNEEDEMAAMEMDKALAEGQVSLWPDDESRLFYENLIDIRNIVPRSLYKGFSFRNQRSGTIQENELKTSVDDIDVDGLEAEPSEREGDPDIGEKEENVDEPYRPKTPPSPAQFNEDMTSAGDASLITSEEMKQLAQVKFGVIPRAEALSCLRQLVYDFRGHSVDMVCAMIETAGFYLYRNSDSHPKMKIILDVVQKKKERIKDVRH
ncbi:hypothetical protein OSTOST_22459, partial [Ostertagia ostertagi]